MTCRFSRRLVRPTPFAVAALVAVVALAAQGPSAQAQSPHDAHAGSFYDLKVKALDGKPADLSAYRGQVAVVVNVASKCGFTPQYTGLEKLSRDYKGKGVVVLGFPSNDFGGQEPGTAEEIATFCRLTYDVTFPMFEKSVTKKGPDQSPVYTFLGASGDLPSWNFGKYVVDKQGRVVAYFPSKVTPDAPELRDAIAKALAAN
jgi:glutathione peroxidase